MADLRTRIQENLPLTMGEVFALSKEFDVRVMDVVLIEAELRTGLAREELLTKVMDVYVFVPLFMKGCPPPPLKRWCLVRLAW